MAIAFPGEGFAPQKPDLEFIESFDNSQVGGVEKFGTIDGGLISVTDVLPLSGGTMTGPIVMVASATGLVSGSYRVPVGTAPTSPSEGATWNDSAQKSLMVFLDAIKQALVGTLYTATASGTVGGTSTETTLIGSGIGTLTLPTNFFTVGKTIRITASGYHGTAGAAATLNIRVKLGSTTIMATGDQTPGNSISNRAWKLVTLLTCRTVGGSGTVIGNGIFERLEAAAGSPVGWGMVNTSAVTVDTTAAQAINLTADWGGTDAADTITCTNFSVDVLY